MRESIFYLIIMESGSHFNFGVRLGLFLVVEAATLSSLSTGFLLLYIVVCDVS